MTCDTDDVVYLDADPQDYLDYGHDLTKWLAETTTGDTISTVTVTADPPTAATINNPNVVDAGRQVVAWVTATADVELFFKAVTTQGRTKVCKTVLTVVPRA